MLSDGKPRPVGDGWFKQIVWSDLADPLEDSIAEATWSTDPLTCCQSPLEVAFAWTAPIYWTGERWAPLPQICRQCWTRHFPQHLAFAKTAYTPPDTAAAGVGAKSTR